MSQVMAKVRTIALAVEDHLKEFMASEHSAGERLVAIAILQLRPRQECIAWLADRTKHEQPFVFYQASLALLSAVRALGLKHQEQLKQAIESADAKIRSFPNNPDQNSLRVLEQAAQELMPG